MKPSGVRVKVFTITRLYVFSKEKPKRERYRYGDSTYFFGKNAKYFDGVQYELTRLVEKYNTEFRGRGFG